MARPPGPRGSSRRSRPARLAPRSARPARPPRDESDTACSLRSRPPGRSEPGDRDRLLRATRWPHTGARGRRPPTRHAGHRPGSGAGRWSPRPKNTGPGHRGRLTRRQQSKYPGDDLFSQGVAPRVSSALESLTSVFGMGTGGSSPLASPGYSSIATPHPEWGGPTDSGSTDLYRLGNPRPATC